MTSAADDEAPRPSTRTRILLATLAIVDKEGMGAVTHRAVAARAGVSPGSTTHHFSSREELLREAFVFYLAQAEEMLRSLVVESGDRGGDPLAVLRRQIISIVEREFAEGFVRAEYELRLHAARDRALAAEVRTWQARWVAICAENLEAAGVERPITMARMLLGLVQGYELERLVDPTLTLADFEARIDLQLAAIAPVDPESDEEAPPSGRRKRP